MADNEVIIPPTENVLEKFGGDVDKLAQSYANLERELTRRANGEPKETLETPSVSPETPEVPQGEDPKAHTPTEGEVQSAFGEGITSAVTNAGLDMNALQAEFQSESGLTEETRTKLNGIFGQQAVDTYLNGLGVAQQQQQQVASDAAAQVLEVAGGEENWQAVQSWAVGPNGRADLVETFNSAIDANNPQVMKVAAEALRGAYEAANGSLKTTSIKQGAAPASGAPTGFQSTAQMTQAMQDPRYATDPAYREEVAQRIAATKFS